MTQTANYELNKFDPSDRFDLANGLNANMDTIDEAFGGVKLLKLTQSEYDALEFKDPDTLYIVIPDPEEVEP